MLEPVSALPPKLQTLVARKRRPAFTVIVDAWEKSAERKWEPGDWHQGTRVHTAKILGINVTTFDRWLRCWNPALNPAAEVRARRARDGHPTGSSAAAWNREH